MNWLQEFLKLFPEATERQYSRKQRLEDVESAVSDARSNLSIGQKTLRDIEESDAWNYPWFWPKMSEVIKDSIPIPADLTKYEARHSLISALYKQLRHIEVVSVILRFIYPEEFGIMSPPVSSFLRLLPLEDNVSYYEQYLNVLEKIKNQYKLERIADADMAMWSASHLYLNPDYSAIVDDMREDEYFQDLLFRNTISGWGTIARQTKIDHILFAEAFLKHDYLISAVIAARIFESDIRELASKLDVKTGATKINQSKTGALVNRIGHKESSLHKIDISPGELKQWWGWRIEAVHELLPKNWTGGISGF